MKKGRRAVEGREKKIRDERHDKKTKIRERNYEKGNVEEG